MSLIPKLIEMGIDVLNPIQWHLPNMDLKKLKKQFGKDICFHGGIDNQDVLPFGTVEDVRKEVITCIDILAEDKTGYILAPCHNVQVVTPVENVLAMYNTAKEYWKS
jgi:uroporphyrinogen decarboxylase